MPKIIGVDFSGAKVEGKTWVAEGNLTVEGQLRIDHVQPIRRDDLFELLGNAPASTVAALDFPFGLPKGSLEDLGIGPLNLDTATMRDVWPGILDMSLDEYRAKCRQFRKHLKRKGDDYYSVSMSAFNTRLVPMTHCGIEMLQKLEKAWPHRWWVPPVDVGPAPADKVTLLEVMPGAFLWSIGFDYTTVKSYKRDAGSLDIRNGIIDQLSAYAGIEMPNLSEFRWGSRANDDALDSVVAAVAAALWAVDSDRFCKPKPGELADARLEGWIYASQAQ